MKTSLVSIIIYMMTFPLNAEIQVQLDEIDKEIKKVEDKKTERETLKIKYDELQKKNKELKELSKKLKKAKEDAEMSTPNGTTLNEFGFGIGFGAIFLGEPDIINAVSDNAKVRVTGEEEQKLGIWLTTSWVNDRWPTRSINFGPFFGVQLGGNNQIVNSLAVGFDFSLKKLAPELPLDFQFGWAWTRTKELADGYSENGDIPTGSSQVILKDVVSDGFVFIASYNF